MMPWVKAIGLSLIIIMATFAVMAFQVFALAKAILEEFWQHILAGLLLWALFALRDGGLI